MILADDIVAAAGSPNDLHGMLTSLARALIHSERFVLSDDVAVAGYELSMARPSSVLLAMERCRSPYPSTWIEWDGRVSTKMGWGLTPAGHEGEAWSRYIPTRLGCLVESDAQGQRGEMTFAWKVAEFGVCMSGVSLQFDFGGHVEQRFENGPARLYVRDVVAKDRALSDADLSAFIKNVSCWKAAANDPVQLAAARELAGYSMPWLSRHADNFYLHMELADPGKLREVVSAWMGDIQGECAAMNAFLLLLNAPNALEVEQGPNVDKLNRARAKHGRPALLSHRVTRLRVSAARMRDAKASGMTAAQMRAHLVRGHFKVRQTGVFWWTSFVRGTHGTVDRARYEVMT